MQAMQFIRNIQNLPQSSKISSKFNALPWQLYAAGLPICRENGCTGAITRSSFQDCVRIVAAWLCHVPFGRCVFPLERERENDKKRCRMRSTGSRTYLLQVPVYVLKQCILMILLVVDRPTYESDSNTIAYPTRVYCGIG